MSISSAPSNVIGDVAEMRLHRLVDCNDLSVLRAFWHTSSSGTAAFRSRSSLGAACTDDQWLLGRSVVLEMLPSIASTSLVDLLQHWSIVVDDKVEDGVEDIVLAMRQDARAGFASLAHGAVGRRCAMANRHDIALSDEQMRFAESNSAIQNLRRTSNNEQRITVLLDLRLLMGLGGILDGQRMQLQLSLDALEQFVAGLEQADPDDMTRAGRPGAGLFDRNVGNPAPLRVYARRDNAGLRRRRG